MGAISIPDELIKDAIKEVLDQKLEIDDLKLLDINQAAKLLGMTKESVRNLKVDTIDFGERTTRWSLADLRKVIESKRVKCLKR